jgi:hypothetical protein
MTETGQDGSTTAELRSRIAALEAENEELRAAAAPRRPRRFAWRSLGSVLCIVLAAVLIPVSVVAGWARAELVDQSRFVATFAPLADDPAVQTAVRDAAVALIDDQIDIDRTTGALFDGIEQLGLSAEAADALDLLRGPAAQGVRTLLSSGIETFVRSDLFSEVWTTALVSSHRAMLAAVSGGDDGAAVVIDASGRLVIQLAPIISEITTYLADNGFALAAQIPTIDATFVVAQSDSLALVSVVYPLATQIGYWLPLLAFALLLAGLLLARDRRRGTIAAGAGAAVGGIATIIAIGIGAHAVALTAVRSGIPSDAAGAVYGRLVQDMRDSAADVVLVGAIAVLLGALTAIPALVDAVRAVNTRVASAPPLRARESAPWRARVRRGRALSRAALIVLPVALLVLLPVGAAGITVIVLAALVLWWIVAVVETSAEAA